MRKKDQEIKNINIVELVSKYTKLEKKTNHLYVGVCPFCKKPDPSFVVLEEKELAKCFACAGGGTKAEFYQQIKKKNKN